MKDRVTIDSSVIIASFLKHEKRHNEALEFMKDIFNGKNQLVLPYTILVEISGAIKRNTKSEKFANEVKEKIIKIPNISFVDLDKDRAESSCNIAINYNLRGMDAIVVQVSREFNTELITFDNEMKKLIEKST